MICRVSTRAISLCAALFAVVPLPAATAQAAAPMRPNVLFIMADDLGYADVGCYGQQRIKTPNIDRLAADGLRFTQYYAGNAVCAPSRCVLMTGRHPGHAFVRDNRDPGPPAIPHEVRGQIPIPAELRTIAEEFKSLGYATAGFGKWGLGGPGSTGDPLRHGFDEFFGYLDQWHAHNYYPQFLYKNDLPFPLNNPPIDAHGKLPAQDDPENPANYRRFIGSDYAPDRLAEQALEFITKHGDTPFFLYYPTIVPHVALQVPEDSLSQYRGQFPDPHYDGKEGYCPQFTPRAAYAAMITRMDGDIGRLLRALADRHLAEQTIVVFTSDNGAVWGHVGGADPEFFASTANLRGYKASLYEGGIRVPCIVRWTGHIAAGTVSDRVTGHEDWYPTLLELVGYSGSLPAGLDGISLAPTLLGKPQPPRPFLYREFPSSGGQQSIRIGDWKAIRQNMLPKKKGVQPDLTIHLYNLASDPSETKDVAAEHPDVVTQAERLLREQHTPSEVYKFPAIDGQ